MDVGGLEENCVGCNVAMVSGSSCVKVGENYYSSSLTDDPWESGVSVYDTNSEGRTFSAFRITNGYDIDENNEQTVILYSSDKNIVGCGVFHFEPENKILIANLGSYPGYDGNLKVFGHAVTEFHDDKSFRFEYHMHGTEKHCDNCAITINEGFSCDSDEKVGGPYYNENLVQDLWTTEGGAVYNNFHSEPTGWFEMYNGYGFEENYHHPVVVYAQDGTKIACGVLY